ncbi:MAG: GNAT family N-acetyltransferase [Acidimicrobiia bacterium]|nr:GNAT family N-acetyltransferase [Acidimicrobiia bacterium]
MVRVDRIRRADVAVLREVRLAALADSPGAFASTHEREAAYDPAEWERRTVAASTGRSAATFFARDEAGQVVGLVGVFENRVDPMTAELVSMWVSPSGRGQGAGSALVERAIAWASEAEYTRVELWVARGNDTAERLYVRSGFYVTGDVQPLPSDPCKDEIRMRLDLAQRRRK